MPLTLIDANGAVVSTTLTASDGSYSFVNLTPGQYRLRVGKAAGLCMLTAKDRFGNALDNVDSDASPLTFMSDVFTLAPGQALNNLAVGFLNKRCIYLPIVIK